MAGREPPLLGAGGGKLGRADDVAGCVDVGDRGLEVLVHEHPAARLRFEPGLLEAQVFGITLPPGRDQHCVGAEGQTALHHHPVSGDGIRLDPVDLLTKVEAHPSLLELLAKVPTHLAVHHVEEGGAHVAQRHVRPKGAEHAGVLDPDHSCAGHNHPAGHARKGKDVVARDQAHMVGGESGRHPGAAAYGEEDEATRDELLSLTPGDDDLLRFLEATEAVEYLHLVARQLLVDHVALALDDVASPGQELLDRDRGTFAPDAVQGPPAKAAQIDDSLP
jgi:hypothetical protein